MKNLFLFLMVLVSINMQAQITATTTTTCEGDSTTLTASPNLLTTTFAAGNNHRGNMFSIVAINTVNITSFDAHPMGNTTVEIYYKTGSYIGFEATPANWTLVGSAPVVAMPLGTATPIPVPINIVIPAGQTYSFYVTSTNTAVSLNYSNGTAEGNILSSDTNIQFLEGKGMEYPFTAGGGSFSPRVWNGNIHYSRLNDIIAWSNGDTATSITVAPTTSSMYYVSVNSPNYTDSIQINVAPNYTINAAPVIGCDSALINGNWYFSSQTIIDSLSTSTGCDSTVTTQLTIGGVSSTDVQTACGSFIWTNGITYTSSNNTATDTLVNMNGCDSIVTLNLTISNNSTGTDVQTACGTFTWIDGNTYTTSNNSATDTLMAANGCDSIVTLNLTINNSVTSTDVQTACGTFTWIDGNTYTSSNNTATDTLLAANGCDSIVTLNLTINNSTTGTDVQTACGSYTWINGITYTSSNNTATDTLLAANGCDSIVTLNLTINSVDNGVSQAGFDLTANQTGASYQWVNCDSSFALLAGETSQTYTATSNGNYAVIVSSGNCIDTSACNSILGVAVINSDFGNQLSVYPNPTTGIISIDLGTVYPTINTKIFNVTGQLIHAQTFNGSNLLSLEIDAPAGLYFLEIMTNDHRKAIIKVVKE